MSDNFKQRTIVFNNEYSNERLKVSKLVELIKAHPHYAEIIKKFSIESMMNEIIIIPGIESAFNAIKSEMSKYEKPKAMAETKKVSIHSSEEDDVVTINFHFDECRIEDELKEGLTAEAIYDSKSSFFDDYSMAKYANYLLDHGHQNLINENVQYFKQLAENDKKYNKLKSYRLLFNGKKYFVRGITSEKYNEYGIDFTFFIIVIFLHLRMKNNKGDNYSITYLSISESKMDMIIKDNGVKKIDHFGQVSHGIEVSTNELGTGSLNATSIVRVEDDKNETMVYLLPRQRQMQHTTKYVISHTTSLEKVFQAITSFESLLNHSDDLIKEIQDIKGLKNPDQLRAKIQMKIEHPNSSFKEVKELKDIFKRKINDQINNFSELLGMCKKAEELEIDYDIKDKLRYIISDIILYGSAQ
ncbi:MAG: hypothetical protein JWN76_3797 [Chitinophagaceae bacterium]|nr:hypothetical protein [Chitinophagaceae bacterium]